MAGGKWWPNYDGEEDVIIDDLRSATYPFLELLGMTDRYPYTIEIRVPFVSLKLDV